MSSPPKLTFNLSQLGAKALRDGSLLNLHTPYPGLPADVRETQKVEAFRFAQAARAPSLLYEVTELDHAGFL